VKAKKILMGTAGALGVAVLFAGGAYGWAMVVAESRMARTFEIHAVDFPIPFPIPDAEASELGLAAQEVERVAWERAVERGRHLLEARYGCADCHGASFEGGVMVDAASIGRIYGPNLTGGIGSRVDSFTAADWDRMVRHGVRPDRTPAAMPAQDFQRMSDRELSDIIAYLRSRPPLDGDVPPVWMGPMGKVLLATGRMYLSADLIDHDRGHATEPPAASVSVEFGRHLAATCSGCHGADYAGGLIAGGDPSWPPAANLTPHDDALGPWTFEDFAAAMREGVRPDGTPLQSPMTFVVPYAQRMSDVELEAIWTYLLTLEPLAD
jgi:mono/diheme cytochrome c family protein